MKIKKAKVLGFLTFLLFISTILSGCGQDDMRSEKVLNDFSRLIESGKLNDLSLTIYYISPYILTEIPLSVDDLINFNSGKKIVISGSDLEENIDLFKKITKNDLIPVKKTSQIDARFYYVFESEKEGKILDVAMWGNNNSVFVNGFEVEENDVFYDIIKPFLPEDAVKDLEVYIGKG